MQRLHDCGKKKINLLFYRILQKIEDYETYKNHIFENTNDTIHTNLKTLRAILYVATKEDRFPQEKNPFFRFKLKKKD